MSRYSVQAAESPSEVGAVKKLVGAGPSEVLSMGETWQKPWGKTQVAGTLPTFTIMPILTKLMSAKLKVFSLQRVQP